MKTLIRVIVSVVTAAVAVVVVGVSPAQAFHVHGDKWQGSVAALRTQINQTNAGMATAWINGIGAWNNSPTPAGFTRPSSAPWAIRLWDVNDSSVSWAGFANWDTAGGFIVAATGRVNYHFMKNYSAATRQGVTAHELGHILGLWHTNGCVLMTEFTGDRQACGISGPVADDNNGINYLY